MRRLHNRVCTVAFAALIALLSHSVSGAFAQASKGPSGLPLPRFVSLKAKSVNLRVGPSVDYAVSWRYMKSGVPVDADGTEGWVNQALLSGDRTAVTAPWMRGKGADIYVNMRRDPQSSGALVAKLEPGVVIKVGECNGDWCHAEVDGTEGWVAQAEIWGAYPGEAFK